MDGFLFPSASLILALPLRARISIDYHRYETPLMKQRLCLFFLTSVPVRIRAG